MIDRVEEAVAELEGHRAVLGFYPKAIAGRTGLPLEDVERRLLELARDGRLEVWWEAECPRCGAAADPARAGPDGPSGGAEWACAHCGEVWRAGADDCRPLFAFPRARRAGEDAPPGGLPR